jgi:hypothetical protein
MSINVLMSLGHELSDPVCSYIRNTRPWGSGRWCHEIKQVTLHDCRDPRKYIHTPVLTIMTSIPGWGDGKVDAAVILLVHKVEELYLGALKAIAINQAGCWGDVVSLSADVGHMYTATSRALTNAMLMATDWRSYGTACTGSKAGRVNYAAGCVDCCQERMSAIVLFGVAMHDDRIV